MIEVNKCPNCGHEGPHTNGTTAYGKPIVAVDINGFKLNMAVLVAYVGCLYCGMIWQSPRMEDEEIARWYSEGHYRKWLEQPQEALDKDEYQRAIATAEWVGKTDSLLDIGCSRGYLLDEYDKAAVLGVEYNIEYVKTDLPVVKNLEDVQGTFEAITMIHVLEHVADPISYLKQVLPHMNEKSRLYIEIPSGLSKGGPLRLAHLTYMTSPVLVSVCEKAGLEAVEASVGPYGHTRVVCKKASNG